MSLYRDIQRDYLDAATGACARRHEECRSTVDCGNGNTLGLIATATSCCFLRPGRVLVECFGQIIAHLECLISSQGKEQFTHISVGENCKWHDDDMTKRGCEQMEKLKQID